MEQRDTTACDSAELDTLLGRPTCWIRSAAIAPDQPVQDQEAVSAVALSVDRTGACGSDMRCCVLTTVNQRSWRTKTGRSCTRRCTDASKRGLGPVGPQRDPTPTAWDASPEQANPIVEIVCLMTTHGEGPEIDVPAGNRRHHGVEGKLGLASQSDLPHPVADDVEQTLCSLERGAGDAGCDFCNHSDPFGSPTVRDSPGSQANWEFPFITSAAENRPNLTELAVMASLTVFTRESFRLTPAVTAAFSRLDCTKHSTIQHTPGQGRQMGLWLSFIQHAAVSNLQRRIVFAIPSQGPMGWGGARTPEATLEPSRSSRRKR